MTVCAKRGAETGGIFQPCYSCACSRDLLAEHVAGRMDPGVDQLRDLIAAGWEQPDACRLLWHGGVEFPTVLRAAGDGARQFVRFALMARLPWLRPTTLEETP